MTRPAAVPLADRALAPDVARGTMLLLIALANAHVWLFGHPVGVRAYPVPEGVADRVVTGAQLLLVDGRAYPLFGLLFGYGIAQLAARRTAAGADRAAVTRLVRGRGAWMVLIGLLHGVLLWPGDIVGAYGLVAVVLAGVLVGGAAGTLAGIGVGVTSVAVMFVGPAVVPRQEPTLPSVAQPDYAAGAVGRAVEWAGLGLVFSALVATGVVALGAWAGRSRLLDEPERHRALLVRLAVGGLGAAVLLGAPVALAGASVWAAPTMPLLLTGFLHAAGGYAGGVGYAALFGLLAARPRGRPGPVTRALQACGQRSLSCYLAQSVAFAALLPAWSLGLGARLGTAQAALVAVGVWLVILLVAAASGRAGYRGPAEVLLRWATYGRRAA